VFASMWANRFFGGAGLRAGGAGGYGPPGFGAPAAGGFAAAPGWGWAGFWPAGG
jgi:hypothetical protein